MRRSQLVRDSIGGNCKEKKGDNIKIPFLPTFTLVQDQSDESPWIFHCKAHIKQVSCYVCFQLDLFLKLKSSDDSFMLHQPDGLFLKEHRLYMWSICACSESQIQQASIEVELKFILFFSRFFVYYILLLNPRYKHNGKKSTIWSPGLL